MSLHPCVCRRWLLQVCLGKPSHGNRKSRHRTSVFFCRCASNARFAQGQPNGYFQTKKLDRTTEAFDRMNVVWKVEQAERAEFNVPTWANIAVCQPCRERQPFWNSHDGLILTCLDQCHGVGSHGTSSSQGGRQRIVIKSTVSICLQTKSDRWVYILIFAEGDCCRFA